jgi:Uncharacterized protein conserved in bacteria
MSCYDCSRADLFRKAVAQAGRGLPEIEPGMPIPAGTGLTRREFVSRTAGLALAVYGGAALSGKAFDHGIAQAASDAASAQKTLVTVFFNGGIDGLSVLFPAGDPRYYSLRPNLALPQTAGRAFTEDGRLRWNPAANGLATLHDEGKVSVMPAGATTTRTVALHVAPLLRGRRHRLEPPHRLARAATSTTSARPTTRCRA